MNQDEKSNNLDIIEENKKTQIVTDIRRGILIAKYAFQKRNKVLSNRDISIEKLYFRISP